jgi:NAD(P)-dependent dehydrogenase (short-subunit alcohol dehydrogenase family)
MTQKPLCIISGGTSGIGFGVAKQLAPTHRLALIFQNNVDRAHTAVEEIHRRQSDADDVRSFRADLSDTAAAEQAMSEIAAWDSQPPSVLINCAGRAHVSYFVTDPAQSTLDCVRANLFSCVNLTHLVVKKMYAARRGRVITFSSIASDGSMSHIGYAMAKAAIEVFTKTLSREIYRRGIRVNCIRPGLVNTPMTEPLLNNLGYGKDRVMPMQTVLGAVQFLLSEAAEPISGTVVTVDNDLR